MYLIFCARTFFHDVFVFVLTFLKYFHKQDICYWGKKKGGGEGGSFR